MGEDGLLTRGCSIAARDYTFLLQRITRFIRLFGIPRLLILTRPFDDRFGRFASTTWDRSNRTEVSCASRRLATIRHVPRPNPPCNLEENFLKVLSYGCSCRGYVFKTWTMKDHNLLLGISGDRRENTFPPGFRWPPF